MSHVLYKGDIWFLDKTDGRRIVGSLNIPLIGWRTEQEPLERDESQENGLINEALSQVEQCQYCNDCPYPMHRLRNLKHQLAVRVCRSCKNLLLNQEISLNINDQNEDDKEVNLIVTSICTEKGWLCVYGGRRIAKLLVNGEHELSCIVHVNHSLMVPVFFASVLDHKTNKLWTKSVCFTTRQQAQSASISFALYLWFKTTKYYNL